MPENFKHKAEHDLSPETRSKSPNLPLSRRIDNQIIQIDVKKLETMGTAGNRVEDSMAESHFAGESHDTRDTGKIKGLKLPSNQPTTAGTPSYPGSKPYSDAVSINQDYGVG